MFIANRKTGLEIPLVRAVFGEQVEQDMCENIEEELAGAGG